LRQDTRQDTSFFGCLGVLSHQNQIVTKENTQRHGYTPG